MIDRQSFSWWAGDSDPDIFHWSWLNDAVLARHQFFAQSHTNVLRADFVFKCKPGHSVWNSKYNSNVGRLCIQTFWSLTMYKRVKSKHVAHIWLGCFHLKAGWLTDRAGRWALLFLLPLVTQLREACTRIFGWNRGWPSAPPKSARFCWIGNDHLPPPTPHKLSGIFVFKNRRKNTPKTPYVQK